MLTMSIWVWIQLKYYNIYKQVKKVCQEYWGYLKPLLENKSTYPMVTMATKVASAGLSWCCPVDGWLHYCTTACCVTSSWTQQWCCPLPIKGCCCVFAQVEIIMIQTTTKLEIISCRNKRFLFTREELERSKNWGFVGCGALSWGSRQRIQAENRSAALL